MRGVVTDAGAKALAENLIPCADCEPSPRYAPGNGVAQCGEPFYALVRDERRQFRSMCRACADKAVARRGAYVYRTADQL